MSAESEKVQTIRIKKDGVRAGNVEREKGDLATIPRSEADILLSNDLAELAEKEVASEDAPSVKTKKADEGSQSQEKDKSSDGEKPDSLRNWMNPYLGADDVKVGDTVVVLGFEEWRDVKGTYYPFIEVEHDGTKYQHRLNKQNARRIADEFGEDIEEWSGMMLEVNEIREYFGGSEKGIIWKPKEPPEPTED